MHMLTIFTWLWTQPGGRATYTPDHVMIWADMVRRNLTIPHRLAVVTDIEADYGDIEVIAPPRDFEDVRIPTWGPEKPQCLRRISMFRPDAASIFGERFVCMDMDCVIAENIDDLFTRQEDIVLYKSPSGTFNNTRPYNGSMLMMTAGARSEVYTRFTPEGAVDAGQKYIGSDQAWISHVLGAGEATWSEDDRVFWWKRVTPGQTPRIMFFPGSPKPWQLAESGGNDWVDAHYRRSPQGRCMILGYAPNVWDDAVSALDSGPFDAVIASPEASEHWPGEVLAVATDDIHADRLARMHGFDEIVFCGRSEREAA